MNVSAFLRRLTLPAFSAFMLLALGQTFAADSIKGQVLGGGAPIAQSTVTLWRAQAHPSNSRRPKQTTMAGLNSVALCVPLRL